MPPRGTTNHVDRNHKMEIYKAAVLNPEHVEVAICRSEELDHGAD